MRRVSESTISGLETASSVAVMLCSVDGSLAKHHADVIRTLCGSVSDLTKALREAYAELDKQENNKGL